MDPIHHQWFADALAAKSVPNQTNPKLPVLRHMPIALAPVTKAADALPGSLAEHRNRGRLITVCNFRPGGVAKKPAKVRSLKAANRRIDHIVTAEFGQEYRDLDIGWFDQIVRVQAANVSAPGKTDTEIAIVADQMRFRAVNEAGSWQPALLESPQNARRRPVGGSSFDNDDLKVS